ncbi:hypothetical protein GUI37_06090 [Helcococcus kunzii]|uniref:hypothetical protein n=1 Tax=Helcococcus kunzii TaxID=40091 RepID=UPI001BAE7B5C|nr:hypothetical protein [Helcococcus kunzii]QUY65110.1 hypothetical protein GUI37_06090 [Helcococcus kunzii]
MYKFYFEREEMCESKGNMMCRQYNKQVEVFSDNIDHAKQKIQEVGFEDVGNFILVKVEEVEE